MIDVTSASRGLVQRWTNNVGAGGAAMRLGRARFAAHLLMLALGFAIVGCATLGDTRRVSWTEEVRLSTGEVIRIERWEQQELVAEPFQKPGWIFRGAGFKARLPVASAGDLIWEGTLAPLALDLGPDNVVYFVGVALTRRAEREYRLPPDKSHVAFSLRGGQWERITLHELPAITKPNLLANTSRYLDERGPSSSSVVTLETKTKLDSVSGLFQALRVIPRE